MLSSRLTGTEYPSEILGLGSAAPCRPELSVDVGQDRLSHSADDELTFAGDWTAEVLERAATHFDVPAAAVRRRMGGHA